MNYRRFNLSCFKNIIRSMNQKFLNINFSNDKCSDFCNVLRHTVSCFCSKKMCVFILKNHCFSTFCNPNIIVFFKPYWKYSIKLWIFSYPYKYSCILLISIDQIFLHISLNYCNCLIYFWKILYNVKFLLIYNFGA